MYVRNLLLAGRRSKLTLDGLELDAGPLDLEHLKAQKRTANNAAKSCLAGLKERLKTENGTDRKALQGDMAKIEERIQAFNHWADEAIHFNKEWNWLTSRFPDGEYVDVPGLCKVVRPDDIAANDYSLTPGRYVGVASQIDEDFDYEERMAEIKVELQGLNEEAVALAQQIQENLNELGL